MPCIHPQRSLEARVQALQGTLQQQREAIRTFLGQPPADYVPLQGSPGTVQLVQRLVDTFGSWPGVLGPLCTLGAVEDPRVAKLLWFLGVNPTLMVVMGEDVQVAVSNVIDSDFFFRNAFRFPEYFEVEASKARNKRVRRGHTPFRGGAGPSGAGGPTVPEATGIQLVVIVHIRYYAHLGPQKCARRTTLSILLPLFVTCASTSGKTQLQRTARMRHLALQACAAIRKGCNSVHRFPHKKWCFLMPILPYFPGGSRPRTPGRGETPRTPPEWKVP